ncbi:ribose 1,5-bisphosphate isomerase [Halogeometricum borinquense]|uniref:Ribose 1,5-bisphosphate isomerase n=2 Tax=Halogeometricum borinquense TaxID=60847 RepID=E4NPX8_HALBP|nr:ribose 1,5-bisphosphate isomerase [Halogeometricum borinquense]ADQ67723.1 ribose 1,5-bisphosphate isomerase [Halogeometricum borinquense DSM 11551]ELY23596.1 translation initiation factor IF-2B subunit delta [Halogeometricum borinquense DSM 11551]QIB73691.1 ribose 1,5-bisphosphate isomerase [Halogeometricum borinquense]QIQ76952.1 ribose 1,5-bisphosphate isomerase [Halogeometricum borinquense]RYJ14853.1 ribose 1,5-bisphosphate isomerase [Halogeometricum borinquense]
MDNPESRVTDEVRQTADAIGTMEIRGAATIADAAAKALRTQAEQSSAETADELRAELRAAARVLHDTRPTAVSLPNALRYVLFDADGATVEDVRASVVTSVVEFCDRLENAQTDLGRVGANRLRDGDTIMTHCHSTDVLACVEAAVEQGKDLTAIVKETRPRLQGHITARELVEMGVDVTLIVDSAARRYMNDVDHVLVGADSIAADGSVINKIGTSGLAVTARDRGTPIVCAAQTIKLHPDTLTGHTVDIEMREESEVIDPDEADEIGDITVKNPAFDVTPPRYVDAIVTERGQYPPESIVTLMRDLFGEGTTEPWVVE